MIPLKITPLPGCTPGTVEKIDALNRKLGLFIHAPLNLKEVLRMEPFAADAEVVRAVAATLDNYAIIPTSPTERERQRRRAFRRITTSWGSGTARRFSPFRQSRRPCVICSCWRAY